MSDKGRDDGLASPELRRMIKLAGSQQKLPRVRVTADQIFEAYQERRERRRQRWLHGGLAAAACLSLIYLGVSVERALYVRPAAATLAQAEAVPATPSEVVEEAAPLGPRLAAGAAIELLEPHGIPAEVIGPHAIRLSNGTYRIDVEDEGALTVLTPEGELGVETGRFTVAVASSSTDVIVESGVAYWVRDGEREPVTPPQRPAKPEASAPELLADAAPARPSAAELAELAEASLRRGQRPAAIRHLRSLVTTYPRSSEAGRGLLDLGRLERAEGDLDASRCAYQLYLDRYPSGSLTADVERALDRLGPGPRCRGLRPR